MIKRLFLTLAVTVGLLSPAYSAGLYPLSRYQQFDANGKLMVGAKLYLFNGGTSTPRTGYKDSSLTAPHPNPIVADAAGRLPLIYLADGFYRQRLTTSTGVQVFDDDGLPVLSSTAGGSGTSVDPDSVYKTGDIKIRYDDQPLSGFVRMNGRTIGSPSSGATERANADTQPLYEFLWPRSNISVAGGKGASASADFAANKALTLPDGAGRNIAGMDDMGAGRRNVLTNTSCSNAAVLGGLCGLESYTIGLANLPSWVLTGAAVSVSVSGTTGNQNALHVHTGSATTSTAGAHRHQTFSADNQGSGTAPNLSGANFAQYQTNFGDPNTYTIKGSTADASQGQTSSTGDHAHTVTINTGTESVFHQHAFTGTGTTAGLSVNSGGSGATFATLSPNIVFTIYIRL
jgi:hypothetical protein